MATQDTKHEDVGFPKGKHGSVHLSADGILLQPSAEEGVDDPGTIVPWSNVLRYRANKEQTKMKITVKQEQDQEKKDITLRFSDCDECSRLKKDLKARLSQEDEVMGDSFLNGSTRMDESSSKMDASLGASSLGKSFRASSLGESFLSDSSRKDDSSSSIPKGAIRKKTSKGERKSMSLGAVPVQSQGVKASNNEGSDSIPPSGKTKCEGVVYNKEVGTMILTGRSLSFQPLQGAKMRCAWSSLKSHTTNKASAEKPKLKLVLEWKGSQNDTPSVCLFTFSSREELVKIKKDIEGCLKQLADRDGHPPMGESVPRVSLEESVAPALSSLNLASSGSKKHRSGHDHGDELGVAVAIKADGAMKSPSRIPIANATLPMPPHVEDEDIIEHVVVRSGLASEPQPTKENGTLCIEDPAMWSISCDQLMELKDAALNLLGKKAFQRATMRDVNEAVIQPVCQETGTSYALSRNPEGLLVEAFITHAWDEPFEDFIKSVRDVFHAKHRKPSLWICACALYQGDAEAIAAQLGTAEDDSLDRSPFVRALSKASMHVVARNASVDVHSRIWCVAELLQSEKQGLIPDNVFVTGPDKFSSLSTSCLDAQAFDPKDRDKILKMLLTEHDRERIDAFVHEFRSYEALVERKKGYRSKVLLTLLIVVAIIVGIAVGVKYLVNDESTRGDPIEVTFAPTTPSPTSSMIPSMSPSVIPTNSPTTPRPTVAIGSPSASPTTRCPTTPPTERPTMAPTSSAPTSQMESADMVAFRSFLPPYSQEHLSDPSSPQFKALQWLADNPDVRVHYGQVDYSKLLQLFALVTIFHSWNGEDWPAAKKGKVLDADSSSGCSWGPLVSTCDSSNRVTHLRLAGDGREDKFFLSGSMPNEIALLTSLETLFYEDLGVSGPRPLSHLIPTTLEETCNLKQVTLLYVEMEGGFGTIPTQLGALTQLTALRLWKTGVEGTIHLN